MEKKHIAIVVFGEYACKNFIDEHKGEVHTDREWKQLADEFVSEGGESVFLEKHSFDTEAERDAFADGVNAVDDYVSSDFYTAVVITDGAVDTGYSF